MPGICTRWSRSHTTWKTSWLSGISTTSRSGNTRRMDSMKPSHCSGVQEGIVEQIIVQRLHRQHHVADAAALRVDGVDAGETADALGQVEFGFRGVGGPGSAAEAASPEPEGGAVVVRQSREAEFRLRRLQYQIIGRTARLRA